MCMYIDKEFTRKFLRRFEKNGKTVCFKILRIYEKAAKSPFYPNTYIPGWKKSNRKKVELHKDEIISGSISKGIHVYTNLKKAIKSLFHTYEIIIPVICYKKDFVAAGHLTAVFTKVFVPKLKELRQLKVYYNANGCVITGDVTVSKDLKVKVKKEDY